MEKLQSFTLRSATTTRRQMIAGAAVSLSSLATCFAGRGEAQQTPMQEKPGNDSRTALHQEIAIEASPKRIYAAILTSAQFAAFSGLAAEIDPSAGGTFSMFNGQVTGMNIEILPNERIVQAWRPTSWEPGDYSIARFDLKPQGSGTTVVLEHKGFPAGDAEHLDSGWHAHYWEPLKKYLS